MGLELLSRKPTGAPTSRKPTGAPTHLRDRDASRTAGERLSEGTPAEATVGFQTFDLEEWARTLEL